MNEYTIEEYEAFTNANNINNTFKEKHITFSQILDECNEKINDASIIEGPIAENLKVVLQQFILDGEAIADFYEKNTTFFIDAKEKYEKADKDAEKENAKVNSNLIAHESGVSTSNRNIPITEKVKPEEHKAVGATSKSVAEKSKTPQKNTTYEKLKALKEKQKQREKELEEKQKEVEKIRKYNREGSHASTPPSKSSNELANEVIRGDWGNGKERYDRLTEKGYDYDEIQKIVNDKLLGD